MITVRRFSVTLRLETRLAYREDLNFSGLLAERPLTADGDCKNAMNPLPPEKILFKQADLTICASAPSLSCEEEKEWFVEIECEGSELAAAEQACEPVYALCAGGSICRCSRGRV